MNFITHCNKYCTLYLQTHRSHCQWMQEKRAKIQQEICQIYLFPFKYYHLQTNHKISLKTFICYAVQLKLCQMKI